MAGTYQRLTLNSFVKGTVGIQLRHGNDERAQLHDAARVTVEAVRRLVASDKKISEPPSSCHETQEWTDGEELYRLRKTNERK